MGKALSWEMIDRKKGEEKSDLRAKKKTSSGDEMAIKGGSRKEV
jgi:hypothetical protein